MAVPKLYKHFYPKKVFSFSDILNEFGDKNTQSTLRAMVRDCINSKYMGYIKEGLYYIIPEETRAEDCIVDRFLVANKLTEDGIIAYHSALEMHGAANSLFNMVYVLTNSRFKRFKFQGIQYVSILLKNKFGTTSMKREGISVKVTDRERTFLDCLDRLKYSGGLEEFLKSVQTFPSINVQKIVKYLEFYNKKVLYSKTGYVLGLFRRRWPFAEEYRCKITSGKAKKIYYLEKRDEKKHFDKEWNLIVPEDVEKYL